MVRIGAWHGQPEEAYVQPFAFLVTLLKSGDADDRLPRARDSITTITLDLETELAEPCFRGRLNVVECGT